MEIYKQTIDCKSKKNKAVHFLFFLEEDDIICEANLVTIVSRHCLNVQLIQSQT